VVGFSAGFGLLWVYTAYRVEPPNPVDEFFKQIEADQKWHEEVQKNSIPTPLEQCVKPPIPEPEKRTVRKLKL
jgi:hypothetical protein